MLRLKIDLQRFILTLQGNYWRDAENAMVRYMRPAVEYRCKLNQTGRIRK
jgi:hypothetical protein